MVKISRSICLTVISRENEFNRLADFHTRINLPLIKFNGVVGSTLNTKSLSAYSSLLHKSFKFSSASKKARLAIALSHISIWRSLKEYGDSYSLILEDDSVLTDRSLSSINETLNSIDFDWDILFVGHAGKLKGTKKGTFTIAQSGHYPDTNHGMFAYIINPKSIDKVLNTVGMLTKVQHIDWILREKYGKNLIAVYCNSNLISHNNKIQSLRKKLDRI